MIRYSWSAICNRQDRMFSLLNIFSVSTTMLILVSLTGLLNSFKNYSESILDKLPMVIEIFKSKDTLIEDLSRIEMQIRQLPDAKKFCFLLPDRHGKELDEGMLGEELRKNFEINGCHLSAESVLNVSNKGSLWTISHRNNPLQYSVEKEDRGLAVYGVSIFKRVPVFMTFLDSQQQTLAPKDNPTGCTTLPHEPLDFVDIHGKKVSFLDKRKLGLPFDEVGLIVSFELLKKLGHLPPKAVSDRMETWQGEKIPKSLLVRLVDTKQVNNPPSCNLPVPIIGVIAQLSRGDYLITEDFYNLVLNWRHPFRYMLKDRKGQPLLPPQEEVTRAFYVLTPEEAEWADTHLDALKSYEKNARVQIFFQTWESGGEFQERLAIEPVGLGQKLSQDVLETLDRKFREHPELKNLAAVQKKEEQERVREWQEFLPIDHAHQYMQAAFYAKDRTMITPLLERLRGMGLFASSPLERYLKTFESQERFFVGVTVAIFCLVLFLSSVVLFSTFYTSILRKRKEIGIFKAYGASRLLVMGLFYIQSSLIVLLGGGLGVVGGYYVGRVLSQWINRFAMLSESKLIFYLPESYVAFL